MKWYDPFSIGEGLLYQNSLSQLLNKQAEINRKRKNMQFDKTFDRDAYAKGFKDGANTIHGFPSEVTILGKPLFEILDLIVASETKEFEEMKMNEHELVLGCPLFNVLTIKCDAPRNCDKFDYTVENERITFIRKGSEFDNEKTTMCQSGKPISNKGKYIFFPNPDAGKDNICVLEFDAVRTLRKYGYMVEKKRKPIDWSKPLTIETAEPEIYLVLFVGLGAGGIRIVQIENMSEPSNCSRPNVYVPDEDGYIVQFDTWIKNLE